jgi:hypothetical protein
MNVLLFTNSTLHPDKCHTLQKMSWCWPSSNSDDEIVIDYSNQQLNDVTCEKIVKDLLESKSSGRIRLNLSNCGLTDNSVKILVDLARLDIFIDLSNNDLTLAGLGELFKACRPYWSYFSYKGIDFCWNGNKKIPDISLFDYTWAKLTGFWNVNQKEN